MNRFTVEPEVLAQGGSCTVYRAHYNQTNKPVILKRIPADNNVLTENMVREMSFLDGLQHINHPNIVRLLEPGFLHEGFLYLVFESLSMDLNEYMQWYEEAFPDSVKGFLKQILKGVKCCHSVDILHRDIKPENLLVDTSSNPPTIKITDFGSARSFITPDVSLTPGLEVVTAGYRAPELLLGSQKYSKPIDMWSVGCILFEMANGGPLCSEEFSTVTGELDTIFSWMGTPNDTTWPGVSLLPHYRVDFPAYAPKVLKDELPNLEEDGVDLLSKMLSLDPSKRITVEEALEHKYFKSL